jgi:hypothetical protein
MKQEYVLMGLFFALRTEHSGGSISTIFPPTSYRSQALICQMSSFESGDVLEGV